MKPGFTLIGSPAVIARERNAFTLVELLVVIAIIIAMLAILLPSMGRAVYVSQLAACGSNLRQVGTGVLNYAGDHTGAYPYRKVAFSTNPKKTKAAKLGSGVADDRAMLKKYFTLDLLECPLSGFHDGGETIEESTSIDVHASYEMYFGASINRSDSASHMLRLTDRPTTVDLYTGKRFNVNVLAADMDWDFASIQVWNAAHPDRSPTNLTSLVWEGTTHTMAVWYNNQSGNPRGLMDRNFLYRDGSVHLMTNLSAYDNRLARIPANNYLPAGGEYLYLPQN